MANVFVFEETAGRCGKWNSCLAVHQEILLLSLVSCCVCVFSDENCMWFLGKNRSTWAGVRTCQLSLKRNLTLSFDWESPETLGNSSGPCFRNYVITWGQHPIAILLSQPHRNTGQTTDVSPRVVVDFLVATFLKVKRNR